MEFLNQGGVQDGGEKDDRDGLFDIRRMRYDPAFEYAEESCVLGAYVGGGRFGTVYRAALNGETVVVKTNICADGTELGPFISLLLELKMMLLLKKLGSHDNIICFKGANTKHIRACKSAFIDERPEFLPMSFFLLPTDRLQVAMEYCANGNLQEFLRGNRPCFRGTSARNFNQFMNFVNSESGEGPQLTTVDLVKWSMHIAQAMQFLASNRVKIGFE